MIYFMPICDTDQMESQYQIWLPHLPAARQEKLMRYRFTKDRWLCAAAYMLLLHGLQEEYGLAEDQIVIEIADSGKPYLSSHPHIYFSLSHCDAGAACGIDNEPIGIDVESVRRIDTNVVKYFCSAAEQESLRYAASPALAFTTMWTLKESWLKATGYGLSYPLTQLHICEDTPNCYSLDKDGYAATSFSLGVSTVIAVCLPRNSFQTTITVKNHLTLRKE